MISARDALSQVSRAIADLRRDEDRLVTMLKSATDEANRLRASQVEGFKALARLKLDALAREEVVGRLDGAEKRALEAIEKRRGRMEEIDRRRRAIADRRTELDRRVTECQTARDDALEAIEALTDEVEARVSSESTWKAADAAAAEAGRQAEAAAAKARQAEADRDEKRKPYETDPLFMYLWRSGYGTSAYRSGRLVRMMDAKVASLVGYDAARPNYFMLNEIPVRLAEHAERLRAAVAEAEAEREGHERAALVAAGVEQLEAKAEAAEATLAEAVAARDAAIAEEAAVEAEARDLLSGAKDPALSGAIDDLAAAMAREDLRTLYRAALDTPTTEDETIVKGLQEIERALARVTAEAEEVRRASVDIATRRSELERSEQGFRQKGYDDPFGEFADGALIGSVIEGTGRGAPSSRNLEDAFGDGWRRRPPRGNSGGFGGGIRVPRSSGGGSFGGGGFSRGGGSFGGGGFKTGSRF